MMLLAADVCVTVLCISLSVMLNKRYSRITENPFSSANSQAYILRNQVTHARLLPAESANAFTYPTLALLVSLDSLERHKLDLARGWVFGYGGLWGRVVGLRPNPYLTTQSGTIRSKLETLLTERGFIDAKHGLQDAWMMTMPSFLGFEGINPLTVYFCYDLDGAFWLTVLEIHNTFGESHVHVLEVGRNHEMPATGYNHQWTFPREFHVSPFNDRTGFYTISVKSPAHPPMAGLYNSYPPKPSVRVCLHTNSQDESKPKGPLKLTAILRPISATPLTTPSLLLAIAQAPFALLMTLPRILFIAWKLHYKKRLDVFLRPEPLPAVEDWPPTMSPLTNKIPGGVKWLDQGLLDRFAKHRVELFLRRRALQTGTEITIVSGDPSIPRTLFSLPPGQIATSRLTIGYLSPRFFTILFLCPSAKHALLLGRDTEKLFTVSSDQLFVLIFSASLPAQSLKPKTTKTTFLQRCRCQVLPPRLSLVIPTSHFLDNNTKADIIRSVFVIYLHRFLDGFEQWIFTLARARIVAGQEPWLQWERAATVLNGHP